MLKAVTQHRHLGTVDTASEVGLADKDTAVYEFSQTLN